MGVAKGNMTWLRCLKTLTNIEGDWGQQGVYKWGQIDTMGDNKMYQSSLKMPKNGKMTRDTWPQ
jgi:hypothetical protein